MLGPVFQAPSEPRFDRVGERLVGLLRAVGLHERLLKVHYSGILHAMLLSGFVVLLTAIVQDFGSGLFPGFSLAAIGGDRWLALLQDIFAVVIFGGLLLAAWQRYVIRPARFKGSNTLDASIIYVLIACVVVSMLMEAACRIAAGDDVVARWRLLSRQIAALLGVVRGFRSRGFDGSRGLLLGASLQYSRFSYLYSWPEASPHVSCAL